jgi:hypothetical protein
MGGARGVDRAGAGIAFEATGRAGDGLGFCDSKTAIDAATGAGLLGGVTTAPT